MPAYHYYKNRFAPNKATVGDHAMPDSSPVTGTLPAPLTHTTGIRRRKAHVLIVTLYLVRYIVNTWVINVDRQTTEI